ncbi:MAG: hypothetical protein R3304_12725 [Longimicrobiales bacterium]|nr:hypothetical protein [Longimicrobiales bacterium]
MRTAFLLTLGLLATHHPLAAQSAELLSRIDAETADVVVPILEEAARDSLPVDALESKVLEGMAKRVPPERIGPAVAQLADEFRDVRGALRQRLPSEAFTDSEIVAAARAARQGATIDALEELWEARPDGGVLEVPVTVLGELVRRGIPLDEASGLMTFVVRERVPLHVAAQIPGKIDGAMGNASTPVEALTRALRTLNIPDPPGRRPGG